MQKTDSVEPEMASKLDAHIAEADSKPIPVCPLILHGWHATLCCLLHAWTQEAMPLPISMCGPQAHMSTLAVLPFITSLSNVLCLLMEAQSTPKGCFHPLAAMHFLSLVRSR